MTTLVVLIEAAGLPPEAFMFDGGGADGEGACLRVDDVGAAEKRDRLVFGRSEIMSNTCWFCETRAAEAALAYKVPMYGNVSTKGLTPRSWQTNWVRKTVLVPRSSRCKMAHDLLIQVLVMAFVVAIACFASIQVTMYMSTSWAISRSPVPPASSMPINR